MTLPELPEGVRPRPHLDFRPGLRTARGDTSIHVSSQCVVFCSSGPQTVLYHLLARVTWWME